MEKTILITGASTGIGAASAIKLARGNTVFVHYRSSKSEASEVVNRIHAVGGEGILVCADLSNEDGCKSLVHCIGEHTDRLDILINNAGGLPGRTSIRDIDWTALNENFGLNAYSAIFVTALCVPLMEASQAPVVVNVSSLAARNGAPTATLYGAAKGAIDTFTRGAASELAPHIRVNGVAPGIIETPFHERASSPSRMKAFRERTPVNRNGTADDVASTIAFLVENTFITGETIDVNGGLSMR